MAPFLHGGNVYAHPGALDFSASLNPLGIPTAARAALVGQVDAFARYPDPACRELTQAIARFEGVDEDWVLPCAGASDAFSRLCLALLPRTAQLYTPCYSGYEQALAPFPARLSLVRLSEGDDFSYPLGLGDTLPEGVPAVFLANPNNPTGRCLEADALASLLERARQTGATVILDECFIDLTSRAGSTALLAGNPQLVIVKALTKTYALAGLRVGYALSSDRALLERLRAVGQPWAVSVPAQVAGVACLADGAYLDRSRSIIARERRRLECALRQLGYRVVPGEANYLLFQQQYGHAVTASRGRGPQAVPLAQELLARGILIRSCASFHGLDESWYRIAVRTPAENGRLVAALEEVQAIWRNR